MHLSPFIEKNIILKEAISIPGAEKTLRIRSQEDK